MNHFFTIVTKIQCELFDVGHDKLVFNTNLECKGQILTFGFLLPQGEAISWLTENYPDLVEIVETVDHRRNNNRGSVPHRSVYDEIRAIGVTSVLSGNPVSANPNVTQVPPPPPRNPTAEELRSCLPSVNPLEARSSGNQSIEEAIATDMRNIAGAFNTPIEQIIQTYTNIGQSIVPRVAGYNHILDDGDTNL